MCALAFAVSTAFPLTASVLSLAEMPRVLGIADVVMALVLVVTALMVHSRTGALVRDADREASYVVIRKGSVVALVLLAVFLYGRPHINWDVLVVGLVWRGWLFVHVLPALIAALRSPSNIRAGANS